jgi:hypothetical protein
MKRRPGLVTVIGTEGAPHRVSLYRVESPSGAGMQVLARCSCEWTQVNVTGALAELMAYAHIRTHEPP